MINSSCGHLTAEEIFQKLKRKYPNVVLATVYNNLRKLLEEELIKKVSIEGMPDRYDRVNKHDHLVCKCCGRLSDITLKDLTASLSDQLDDDFLYYDLKVYYICPECKKQNKGE